MAQPQPYQELKEAINSVVDTAVDTFQQSDQAIQQRLQQVEQQVLQPQQQQQQTLQQLVQQQHQEAQEKLQEVQEKLQEKLQKVEEKLQKVEEKLQDVQLAVESNTYNTAALISNSRANVNQRLFWLRNEKCLPPGVSSKSKADILDSMPAAEVDSLRGFYGLPTAQGALHGARRLQLLAYLGAEVAEPVD